MLLIDLARTSAAIASTTKRLEKAERLADLLRRLAPDEVVPAVAMLSGALRQGRIGLGPSLVRATVSGEHAAEPALTVGEIDRAFDRLAGITGAGSAGAKREALSDLMRRATAEEADWLARVIVGEVRQGALLGLMEDAIAKAAGIAAGEIRRAAMLSGDLGAVAHAALTEGRAGLGRFHLELFRPVLPMLASPAESLDEVLERGAAELEYKLDGARVQVHKRDDEVRVYSRLLNDVTVAVPELVESVRAMPARELILDGEVIALKPDGTPHAFQATMRRFGRKLDVDTLRADLPLTPFFFDILRRGDVDLIDAPLGERSSTLGEIAGSAVVPRRVVADVAQAEAFFDEALARGHEGIMAKAPASPYAAGSRGVGWYKVKPAHTLDLVVLAIEPGSGRRSGWLSNLHLGARDPATGGFAMIGKTFKGMTDAMLEWQTKRFRELAVGTDGYVVHVRPEQVVEIAFNDVQESPVYASGVALRFARVKRYRDDKTADQADTIETVHAILRGQVGKKR